MRKHLKNISLGWTWRIPTLSILRMLAETLVRQEPERGYLNARDATRRQKNNSELSRTLRVFKVIVCLLLTHLDFYCVCNNYGDKQIGIRIAWYNARLARSLWKSVGEGGNGLLGEMRRLGATPDLHQCNLQVALEKKAILRLSGLHLTRLPPGCAVVHANSRTSCICSQGLPSQIPTNQSLQWQFTILGASLCICWWNILNWSLRRRNPRNSFVQLRKGNLFYHVSAKQR